MKHNFRDLEIWKDSFSVVKEVYKISSQLPDDEKFGLKSQIQRCAISSSYELETQLLLI